MISEATYFGGAKYNTISSDLDLKHTSKRLQAVEATSGGLSVLLPDARKRHSGNPQFYILNVGSNTFTIKDDTGGTLVSLTSGKAASIALVDNTTQAGVWVAQVTDVVGGPLTGIVTLSSVMSFSAIFSNEVFDVRGTVTLSGEMSFATAFAGQIAQDPSVSLSGTMTVALEAAGELTILPTAHIVSASAAGTGDGTLGDPWTVAQAAAAVSPGDTVYLRGGSYANLAKNKIDTVNATVVNGTSGNEITWRNYGNEVPIFEHGCTHTISNLQYHTFQNLWFRSSGRAWVTTRTGSNTAKHLEFDNCTFSCDYGTSDSYTGLELYYVDELHVHDCEFLRWYPGDAIRIYYCDDVLIESCDFSRCYATHSCIAIMDTTYLAIDGCVFRNQWDRVFQIRKAAAGGPYLVQNCIVIDSNYDGVDEGPGAVYEDSWQSGTTDVTRWAADRIICRNNVFVGCNKGKALLDENVYSYTGAWHITLHDSYNDSSYNRVYNCVLHSNALSNVVAIRNVSALPITSTDNKFKNCCISEGLYHNVRIATEDFDWTTWRFEYCRIYHSTVTQDIYLYDAPTRNLSLTEAKAQYGDVFQSTCLDTAPTFADLTPWTDVETDADALESYTLAELFAAFREDSAGDGYQAGTHLAEVTSGGTGTTITVDDAYWFWPGNSYLAGDEVKIGSNSPVGVTAIASATSITVDESITVSTDDEIYLETMTTTPDIGLYALPGASRDAEMSGSFVGVTAFEAGRLRFSQLALAGDVAFAASFSGNFETENNLFTLEHEGGDFSEYDATDVGTDITVAAGAAMRSSSYGLQVVYDDTTQKYAQKNMTWTTRYLRMRFYLDKNTLATTLSYDNFNALEFQTSTGSVRAWVTLTTHSSGNLEVAAKMQDDTYATKSTSDYSISAGDHYVEVEFARATSGSAADGWVKLWIDGSLQETVSSIDVWDLSRPVRLRVGLVRDLTAGASGSFHLDEIVVRDESVEIGA